MNAGVGIWGTWLLENLIEKRDVNILRVKGFVIVVLLAIALIKADALTSLAEDALFVDNIIYAKSSSYQRIIVTKGKTGYALFLNGNLQFNSFDEYRYHEALVHPAFAAHAPLGPTRASSPPAPRVSGAQVGHAAPSPDRASFG